MLTASRRGLCAMRILYLLLLLSPVTTTVRADGNSQAQGVTYDSRSVIIHGRRELLFSGSIHYPRSTPEVINQFS